MRRKGAFLCAAVFSLLAASCTGGGGLAAGAFDAKAYASLPAVRFSSFQTIEEGEDCVVKMSSPYTDIYTVSFSASSVKRVELYGEEGTPLVSSDRAFEIALKEGQTVFMRIVPSRFKVRVTVESKSHPSPLPFGIGPLPDISSVPVYSSDPSDPLQPAELDYTKRPDTLYVYCNAPEALSEGPQTIDRCITRQSLTDKTVFFTMEQQSDNISSGVYYGYRVRNTGTEDLFVTVRNIGYQRGGAGSYLGEQEWTQFFNTRFKLPDLSDLTPRQRRNWEAYFNFSGNYVATKYLPTTYRIPAGKFIYVFGGTTKDAYCNANVGDTANHRCSGGCQNGAVLFDVAGEAEGAYFVYTDPAKIAPGTEGGESHLGVDDPETYGVVHCGEDVGYVVDNKASWVFNDATPAGKLPVTFTNHYMDGLVRTGSSGAEIPSTPHVQQRRDWVTHINVQGCHEAVGTDMTSFHTVYGSEKKPIVVGCDWYDTRGELANIGNWMKDYQDAFAFTNQGDREREVTVNIICTGAMCTMVRRDDGTLIEGSEQFAFFRGDDPRYGDAFDKAFHYTVKIPAHTTVRFVVEYVLMANSTGYVRHSVDLT